MDPRDGAAPVCKIFDYSLHELQQSRRLKTTRRESKKKATQAPKSFRLTLRAEPHDVNTKLRNMAENLEKGHRVRIELQFRRQQVSKEVSEARFDEYAKAITELVGGEREIMRDAFRLTQSMATVTFWIK